MIMNNIRKEIEKINGEIYIKGIWSVDCLFNPDPNERVFDYKFLVVKSLGQGSSYSMRKDYDVKYLKSLMGKNIKDLQFDDLAVEIAVCDSIFAEKQSDDYKEYILDGSSTEKAVKRAEIVLNEAKRLIKGKKDPKIVNVGVVANICKLLCDEGYKVSGTDYDEAIIGKKIYKDAVVYSGDKTLELVKNSDLAIVTGMTLASDTADEIINVAKKNDTKVLIFAETASHLGDFFIEAGADSFVSEPFPFYIYDGRSVIRVKTP